MGLLEPIIALGKTLVQARDEVKLLRYEIDALKTQFDRFDRDAGLEIRHLRLQIDRLKEYVLTNCGSGMAVIDSPSNPPQLPSDTDTLK